MALLSLDAFIRQKQGQLAAEVEGELVIFSVENGAYYNLDDIASDIWRRLAEPVWCRDVLAALLADYDGDPAQIEADTLALLTELLDRELIEIIDSPADA